MLLVAICFSRQSIKTQWDTKQKSNCYILSNCLKSLQVPCISLFCELVLGLAGTQNPGRHPSLCGPSNPSRVS